MFKAILQKIQLSASWLKRGLFVFSTRRAKLIGIAVFFVVAVLFVWVKPAHAYEAGIIASGFLKAFAQIFFFLARLAVQISIFALGFFIKLAEYNGYIDTDTVKVGWALVRDVANMFFVVVLLMIAFGTILGLENYQWNKTLIKFILAAVFINFSNLICGLIIDFAHVFTITFVNAISATAGGNLISMFNLDSVMSMLKSKSPDATKGLEAELFIASVTSFIFAAILAATMIAYAIIMVARVLVLWVLIILSPLAFILQVIPQTQEYAKQWWQKFGKQVVVAPFMVFFLWLAFATLTSGEVAKQFIPDSGNISDVAKVGQIDTTELGSEGMSLSLTEVSTWENMSEFFIAIGLLIVGLGVVQQTGAVGASVAGSAMNFGKKVATIATGYAAGRWAVGKTWQRAKFAGRKVAMTAPIIGGRNWVRLGQKISDRVKETPYLRHLPFIGIGGEYHEKFDKRVKDRIEKNKNARMAELSYYEEDFTKIPFGIGDALGKVMGLKKSSLMKRKAEAREDAAMKQKEFKTGMKTERTEARIRDWGRLHIETVEKNEADKWAEKQGFVGSDEERLAAFRQAAKTDDNLRKQFDKEIKKPVKSLIIPDLESGELRQATFSERVNARSAALMTYMEREKDTYTAVAKQKKGEEDLTYLSTPFGRQRFQDMINADLGDYGEEEINSLKNDEQREILEDKREQLRKVSFGMDKGVDLQTLLKKPIIRAIYAAENKGMTEIGRAKVEKELGSDISSAYIDPEIRGFSTSSEAATIITEFFKQKYDKMTEGQRGASLQANFRLLAKLAALGMPASELQKAAASAIYISAAEHGTVDDGVSAAASDANLLDDYNSLSGEEKANKVNMRKAMADKGYGKETLDMLEAEKNVKALERSKKIAESFNWIEKRAVTEVVKDDKGNVVKDSEGKDKYKAVGYKWSDAGDDEKMLTYSTYALTGGNEEYTRHSWQIGKIKDRDGSSYREAAEKFYGGEDKEYKAKAGDQYESYQDLMFEGSKHRDMFSSYEETLKNHARATGHTQYHSNRIYDDKNKSYRMATYEESMSDKAGAIVKASNTHHNPQGVGLLDNIHQFMIHIMADKLKNLKISKVTTTQALNNVADERFINTVLLWGNRYLQLGKNQEGYAELLDNKSTKEGGTREIKLMRGYGDEDMGTYMSLLKVGAEDLSVNAIPTALAIAAKTGQNEIDAKNGKVKVVIAGTDIKAETMSDLQAQVSNYLKTKAKKIKTSLNDKIKAETDSDVERQMQEDLKLVEGVIKRDKHNVADRLVVASKEVAAVEPESKPIKQAKKMKKTASTVRETAQTVAGVEAQTVDFEEQAQEVEDPKQRHKIINSTEELRRAAKDGKSDDVARLATMIADNIAGVINDDLKNVLKEGFDRLLTAISSMPKLQASDLVSNLQVDTQSVEDPKQQKNIASALANLEQAYRAKEERTSAFGNLNMANSLIENVQERRELAKLFKELKGSDDQSRINNIVIQIKQIVDDPARGFDSALVQDIKINLGKVTIPTGVILDKSLRQVDEVLKDYIEYIQKQKEAYEKEEQQLITDSDDSDKH